MPTFTSKDKLRFGLPLGGIGAGKFEILPNGLFDAFTILNNWSAPVSSAGNFPGLLGFHFGASSSLCGGRARRSVLLQTARLRQEPIAEKIDYEGHFPVARLRYTTRLPIAIELEAFGALLPSNAKDSSLPAVLFTATLTNKARRAVDVGFFFMGRNLCGEWCVGRKNRVEEDSRALSLTFLNDDRASHDARGGSVRFSFEKKGWRFGFVESWNAVTKNFSFTPEDISLSAWETFKNDGALSRVRSSEAATGENRELCAAVSASRRLRPGETARLYFTAAWHFPNHAPGHRYARWFSGVGASARYALKRRSTLRRRVARFQSLVGSLPFPRWFNDALLTNLAPFFSSTWHTKDGRFAFYEAPIVCPLMGTVDVGFYGSIPLAYFFPELEFSQIRQFARAQRPDGYIPHDLGRNRLDLPSDGTTFYRWKDLNPKFILMVYRDFLWSRDRAFLREMAGPVRKALAWSIGTDVDGNGLPDHEGADQTFDLWPFHGANPYTAGLFLAALLACERIAVLTGDRRWAADCRSRFIHGRDSFERELWNGRFFGDERCMIFQLNGQWYADLLGLGDIADPAKVRRALETILKRNGRPSRYGMVNAVGPDGRPDDSNDHSKNIWSGMNYAFVSLCLMRGYPFAALSRQTKKIWNNVIELQKSPWNQPDTIDASTGRFVFGDSYYRNMAIWSIPIAAGFRDAKTRTILKALRAP